MNTPAFLQRRNPKMNEVQRQEPINPSAARMIEDIVRTSEERDALRDDNNALRAEVSERIREVEFLRHELQKASFHRDRLLRYSTALSIRLTDVAAGMAHQTGIIGKALEEARSEAMVITDDQPRDLDDEQRTRQLAQKLAPVSSDETDVERR